MAETNQSVIETLVRLKLDEGSLSATERSIEKGLVRGVAKAGVQAGTEVRRIIETAQVSAMLGGPAGPALTMGSRGAIYQQSVVAAAAATGGGDIASPIFANIRELEAQLLSQQANRTLLAGAAPLDIAAVEAEDAAIKETVKSLELLQKALQEVVSPLSRVEAAALKAAEAEERKAATANQKTEFERINRQRDERLAISRERGGEALAFQKQYGLMTGNPFQVISEVVQRFTGIQKIQDDLENGFIRLKKAQTELANAGRNAPDAATAALEQAEALKNVESAEKNLIETRKRASGTSGKLRAAGDFLATNIVTSGLLFASFAAISTATNAVFEDLSKTIGYFLSPAKAAAASFKSLSDSLSKVGGSEGLDKLINLTNAQLELARAAENVASTQAATGAYGQTVAAQFAASRFGLSPEAAAAQGTGQEFKDLFLKAAGIDTIFKFGYSLDQARAVISQLDPAAQKAALALSGLGENATGANAGLVKTADALKGLGDVPALGQFLNTLSMGTLPLTEFIFTTFALDTAFGGAAQAAAEYATKQAANNKAIEDFDAALRNAQSALFDLGLAAPMAKTVLVNGVPLTSNVQGAQQAVTNAQERLSKEQERISRANTARQRQMQIEEARRKVGQAGVATAGDTIFDVAQRIINAQAEVDKAKRSEQLQGNIAKYTKETAVATRALARERGWAIALEAAPAMLKELAKITDPKERERRAKEMQTILMEFAGTDEIGRAAATLMNLIQKAALRNKVRPAGPRLQ